MKRMLFMKFSLLLIFLSVSISLHSEEPPLVKGLFENEILINKGSDDGVYAGAEGRVYYMRKYKENLVTP